ncbi:sensor histidine kinase [Roseomonas xinghualingensis]|uniref:sensor histidine kinase n=1 Tax=Roseomonas xinghualingensis TaxID=2986475 RepID=UPI0021F0E1A6|nr:sensor histidine kinase [Roseomonas sp. SXEYE001]MCV4208937.1 sensor histidine kinase [Roseomonas sp. SXEYE001]
MIVLLMVAGIPVAAIAVANALQDYRASLDEGRRGVEAFRSLMAVRYGAALGASETLLSAVVRQNPLGEGGRAGCGSLLRRVLDLHPGDITELAIVAPGQPPLCGGLPEGFDPEPLLREALSGGVPAYGAFLPGGPGHSPVLPIAVPGPGSAWALIGFLVPREYAPLPGSRHSEGSAVWLVDRDGRILAPGRAGLPELPAALLPRLEQSAEAVTFAGRGGDVVYASARLNPGLLLVVGHPLSPAKAAASAVLIQRITELATFLIACLAAIVVGADLSMVRPLRLLSVRVRSWRPGNAFRISPSGTEPREVRALEYAFSEAAAALAGREADLRAALEQRDALMGEIHHRVKNNLQIVSSLLNLQASRIGDPAAAEEFLSARNRVRALATLHRHLYVQHSFERVSLRPFLTELTNQQFSSHNEAPGERLALKLDVADITISTDQAVSLSLLVTEAVGNALEHAFPDEARGTIWLSLTGSAGELTLVVQDDGIGLPDRNARPRGLGLQLMEGFAKQLGGQLLGGRMEPNGEAGTGTRWTVRFPSRDNPAPRPMAR